MVWNFTTDRPIYAQIVERIQLGIVSGEYPPGSGMPSVRVLAVEAEVNPNTMQKALQELESQGLLHTQRTAGRNVTDDARRVEALRARLAREHITTFFSGMKNLGIDKDHAIEMLKIAKDDEQFVADDRKAAAEQVTEAQLTEAQIAKEVN